MKFVALLGVMHSFVGCVYGAAAADGSDFREASQLLGSFLNARNRQTVGALELDGIGEQHAAGVGQSEVVSRRKAELRQTQGTLESQLLDLATERKRALWQREQRREELAQLKAFGKLQQSIDALRQSPNRLAKRGEVLELVNLANRCVENAVRLTTEGKGSHCKAQSDGQMHILAKSTLARHLQELVESIRNSVELDANLDTKQITEVELAALSKAIAEIGNDESEAMQELRKYQLLETEAETELQRVSARLLQLEAVIDAKTEKLDSDCEQFIGGLLADNSVRCLLEFESANHKAFRKCLNEVQTMGAEFESMPENAKVMVAPKFMGIFEKAQTSMDRIVAEETKRVSERLNEDSVHETVGFRVPFLDATRQVKWERLRKFVDLFLKDCVDSTGVCWIQDDDTYTLLYDLQLTDHLKQFKVQCEGLSKIEDLRKRLSVGENVDEETDALWNEYGDATEVRAIEHLNAGAKLALLMHPIFSTTANREFNRLVSGQNPEDPRVDAFLRSKAQRKDNPNPKALSAEALKEEFAMLKLRTTKGVKLRDLLYRHWETQPWEK